MQENKSDEKPQKEDKKDRKVTPLGKRHVVMKGYPSEDDE